MAETMSHRGAPAVFSIPVHRSFADALANGILRQHGGDPLALARGIVIAPNNRAGKAIGDAFVRRLAPAMLLPRIVALGDVGDDARISPLFDPADGEPLPPAVAPLRRRLMLARMVQAERAVAHTPVDVAEAMRLATDLARTLDQLHAEEVAPAALGEVAIDGELATHWATSLRSFRVILDEWPRALARMGAIDLADRRNRLLQRTAARWAATPPAGFVVAAGIGSTAKAIARLLGVIARMAGGSVVLAGVDLASPQPEWDAVTGDDALRGIENHPQHHLALLLDRMGVARSDVQRWPHGDGAVARAERSRAVANAFAPARFTDKWVGLPSTERALPNVRAATFATPADEAQGIAIALREALETPDRTAALVTPDRALAQRVVTHLKRWGIEADDSAGRALAETAPGTLLLGLAECAAQDFAPVPLLSVLKHPLVRQGETRLAWLDGARLLDRALRGPRPAPGLAGLAAYLREGGERDKALRTRAGTWWRDVAPLLGPLEVAFAQPLPTLAGLVEALRATVEALAGDAAWRGPAGRALAELVDGLGHASDAAPTDIDVAAMPSLLAALARDIAVRPPQGGHHRIAIWGLIEARLQTADLMVVGGLNEGVWPALPAPDPWLAPRIRQLLGLGGLERRIGIAAHDIAGALGGREVVLTRAVRDARSATVASRFWLRLAAMLGGLNEDSTLPALAAMIDDRGQVQAATQPAPTPPAALRPRRISVTKVDRLNADPFAFYADAMLRLRALDRVDAEPGPAWRGTAVHDVLDRWAKAGDHDPATLQAMVRAMLNEPGIHPIVRAMWAPRLVDACDWIARTITANAAAGRTIVASECDGAVTIAGVELHGRADRIDRDGDGLAIVDYKSGSVPSDKSVRDGFSMQLGLLGLIAEEGGFADVAGVATRFEYWSLGADPKQKPKAFGKLYTPVGEKETKIAPDQFVARATDHFVAAAAKFLTGDAPFTAKLHPDYAPFGDYDQLMRLDEWYGREEQREPSA